MEALRVERPRGGGHALGGEDTKVRVGEA